MTILRAHISKFRVIIQSQASETPDSALSTSPSGIQEEGVPIWRPEWEREGYPRHSGVNHNRPPGATTKCQVLVKKMVNWVGALWDKVSGHKHTHNVRSHIIAAAKGELAE